jgi:hypothetical protein
MTTNVRALQRRLLLVSGGVVTAVGVTGYVVWRNFQQAARKLLEAQTRKIEGASDGSDGAGGARDEVVVKRVLVRRRVGAGPDELGEVLEEHVIGRRSVGATAETASSLPDEPRATTASGGLRERAKQLSMPQKVTVFGSLVAVFVGFNLWVLPKMRRTLQGAASGGGQLFPAEALAMVPHKRLFVDLACGDGERLLEASRVFEEVSGFEPHGRTSWRARKRLAEVPNVRVTHLRKPEVTAEDLARADLVYCCSASVAATALPAMKSGGSIFAREEVPNARLLWSGENARLYRKD